MPRTRHVIDESLDRVLPHEETPGVAYLSDVRSRVCHDKAQVLRGIKIGKLDSLPDVSYQSYQSLLLQRFLGNIPARQVLELLFNVTFHIIGYLPRGSYQDCRSQRSEERRVGKECRSRWSP